LHLNNFKKSSNFSETVKCACVIKEMKKSTLMKEQEIMGNKIQLKSKPSRNKT
jgi:hypothetical protein